MMDGDDWLDLYTSRFLYVYLHEEDTDDESRSLAVAHLTIMQRIGFHDVEEAFLAQSIFLFEEVVFGVRARNVATDNLSETDVIFKSHTIFQSISIE